MKMGNEQMVLRAPIGKEQLLLIANCLLTILKSKEHEKG